jgi:hypothetical protein
VSTGVSDQDAQLLRAVADVYTETDPVPAALLSAAKAALSLRRLDALLAELTSDSQLAPLAGIRADHGPRLLTFEAGPVTVEVEVAVSGGSRRLTGQLVPPAGGEVELRYPTGSSVTTADDLGHFVADVPAGPVSLVCRLAGFSGPPVATSWVTV